MMAIKELRTLQDVVIKPSDKGGNIVIWPKDRGFARLHIDFGLIIISILLMSSERDYLLERQDYPSQSARLCV
ncbi:hypothetical protein FKM82_010653 [Ascaphus truei]